ncbi:MAG: hypothetical protein ACRC2Y_04240 [Aeromonas veronii]
MSHIGISLSANTAQYVQRIKEARSETDRNIIRMEKRFDTFANEVSSNMTDINGSMNAMVNGLRGLKFGGYIAGAGALTLGLVGVANAYTDMANRSIEANKELVKTSQYTRMTVEELTSAEGALKSIGVTMEQFGDWGKDLADKLGDFATAGSGPFVDFFDVIRTGSKMTIADLQGLSTIDAYKKIVGEMEAVGASFEQIKWVMEGLGNEAASMVPLLANGGKEYDRLVSKLGRTKVQLLGSTKEDFQSLDASLNAASNNFEVYLTERFKSVANKFDVLWNSIAGKFNDAATIEQNLNIKSGFLDGTITADMAKTTDEVKRYRDGLIASLNDSETKLAELNKKVGSSFNGMGQYNLSTNEEAKKVAEEQNKKIREQLELLDRREAVLKSMAAGGSGTASIESDGAEAQIAQLQHRLTTAVQLERKAEEDRIKLLKEAAAERAKIRADMSDEQKKEIEENAKRYEAASRNESDKIRIQQSEQKKLRKDLIEESRKEGQERLDNIDKFATEGVEKLKAGHAKELYELQTAFAQQNITQEQFNAKKLELEENLAEDLAKLQEDKQKKLDDSEMKRLSAAITYATSTTDKLNAQYRMDVHNLSKALDDKLITQAQFDANKKAMENKLQIDLMADRVDSEVKKLNTQRQFATTAQEERRIAHEAELLELSKAKNEGLVTEAQFLDKQSQLQRDFEENERTLKMANFLESETVELMNAQIAMERLKEQQAANLISEDEFAKQRIEIEKRVSDAKQAFATAQLDTLAGTFGQMASMSEEGSKRQKAALVAQQAATLASMTMNQWQAWSNIDAPDSPYKSPIAAGIAKAAVIAQYASGLANVTAALGQFHNGGEIDQTGSYILKAGERVVAPDTNKDLKSFLGNNQNGSGAVNVEAPLIIEGDTTIDENRLTAMMVKQREQIAKAIKLAQRENPSLR